MTVAPSPTLERLADALKALITAAESANWEQVEALSAVFLDLQQAVTTIAPPRHDPAPYKRQLKEILALHERAMALCKDRMTVIEPLVRALSASPTDPNAP